MEKNEWSNQVIVIRCGLGDVVYNNGAHRAGNVHYLCKLKSFLFRRCCTLNLRREL